jgi:hypothetical protein
MGSRQGEWAVRVVFLWSLYIAGTWACCLRSPCGGVNSTLGPAPALPASIHWSFLHPHMPWGLRSCCRGEEKEAQC